MNSDLTCHRGSRGGRLVALAAALALAAGCAGTGTIQGRVRSANGSAGPTVVTAWPEAEVAPPRVAGHAGTGLAAGRFAPPVLIVTPGTTVEFANHDRVFHAPFSVSPTAAFDLGFCAPASTHAVVFDRPGVVQVYCALHPREVLYVVVAPDRWHTLSAQDGTFAFRNVPYGTYLVRAWQPAAFDITKRVRVDGAEPVQVNFRH